MSDIVIAAPSGVVVNDPVPDVIVAGAASPSTTGGTVGFLYTQTAPASIWDVYHALGYEPLVQVRDTSGAVVGVGIQHLGVDHLQVQCDPPLELAGTAYCI